MKILFLAPYRDGTGYGHAAQDYILALDSVGADVVCRPLKYNNINEDIPQRLKELENKSVAKATHCIQYTLPHYMSYNGKFRKNIAMFETETSSFKGSSWPLHINFMDEVWLTHNDQLKTMVNSGINITKRHIGHAIDTAKFQKNYEPLKIPNLGNNFVFYFIGEFNRRKALLSLLIAFHTEFSVHEDVSLLLKLTIPGISPDETHNRVRAFCADVKNGLKLYRSQDGNSTNSGFYKEDVVIAERIDENNMCRLHNTGNSFVMPSYGEAWCLPLADALGFGRPSIVNNTGGMRDLVTEGLNGYLCNNMESPVFGMNETFLDLYRGDESWHSVDIMDLRRTMREMFSSRRTNSFDIMCSEAAASVYNHSYEIVGNRMLEALE